MTVWTKRVGVVRGASGMVDVSIEGGIGTLVTACRTLLEAPTKLKWVARLLPNAHCEL